MGIGGVGVGRISALVLLAGCAAGPAPAVAPPSAAGAYPAARIDAASVGRGRVFIETRCSGCHAIGPTGDSPLAAAPRMRDLGRRYPVESLQEAFAEGVLTAHPAMPEFVLQPNEIADVIAYLKSLDTPPAD